MLTAQHVINVVLLLCAHEQCLMLNVLLFLFTKFISIKLMLPCMMRNINLYVTVSHPVTKIMYATERIFAGDGKTRNFPGATRMMCISS